MLSVPPLDIFYYTNLSISLQGIYIQIAIRHKSGDTNRKIDDFRHISIGRHKNALPDFQKSSKIKALRHFWATQKCTFVFFAVFRWATQRATQKLSLLRLTRGLWTEAQPACVKGFRRFYVFRWATQRATQAKIFFSHKTAHKHIFHVHRKRGGRRPPFSFPGTLRVPLYVTELLRSLIFRTAVLPAVLLLILS